MEEIGSSPQSGIAEVKLPDTSTEEGVQELMTDLLQQFAQVPSLNRQAVDAYYEREVRLGLLSDSPLLGPSRQECARHIPPSYR